MMDSLSPTKQNKRSPSPSKAPVEFLQTRKSFIINESELDQKMKHWQEYKLKGLKISRRSYHSAAVYGKRYTDLDIYIRLLFTPSPNNYIASTYMVDMRSTLEFLAASYKQI